MMTEKQIPEAGSRRSTKRNFLVMALLVFVLIGVAVYANIWKDSRRVGEIVVEGNRIVGAKDIIVLAKVPANSLLFELDLFAVEQRVMKNDYVKSVAVHRDLPNRVRISIEERIPVAALVMDKLYYLDAEGYILPHIRSNHIFDLPAVTGLLDESETVVGKQTKSRSVLDALYVLSVAQEISEDMYRNISEIHVKSGRGLVFYTAESGIPVILGSAQVGTKLVKFDAFWKSIVAPLGAHRLQYIDLRFDDRVVVRWNHDDSDAHS